MMLDACSEVKLVPSIDPQVATNNTALVGAIIDHANAGAATYGIQLGTLADADATFVVTLDHGDDPALADAAAVTSADLVGTLAGASFTFAEDQKTRKFGYIGGKRYTRLTITPANNSGNAPISAMCILSRLRKGPTSQASA